MAVGKELIGKVDQKKCGVAVKKKVGKRWTMIATEHCVSLYKETEIDLIESSSFGGDLYWKPDHRKQKEGGGEGEGERVGRDKYFAQSPVPSPTQHNPRYKKTKTYYRETPHALRAIDVGGNNNMLNHEFVPCYLDIGSRSSTTETCSECLLCLSSLVSHLFSRLSAECRAEYGEE